jgi:hypothetical protein
VCESLLLFLVLIEILLLVKELTKFRDVFYTSRSYLFIGVGWRFGFYNLDVSVQIIVVSNLITSLNLAFLKKNKFDYRFFDLYIYGVRTGWH